MGEIQTSSRNPTRFTLLLLSTAFLGVQLIYIDIGFFKLSPYRILLILAPLLLIKWYRDRIPYLRKSINYSYFKLLLFWAFYSFATLFLVADIVAWSKSYVFFISAIITSIFIGLFLKKKDDFIKAFLIIEVIAIFLGLIGFYEIITGDYRYISEEHARLYLILTGVTGNRIPISIFYNPNDFATFCIFSFYISALLTMVNTHKLFKLISLLACLSFIVLIIATESRGGFMGFVASIPFFILSLLQARTTRYKLLIIISCCLLVIFFRTTWSIYFFDDIWRAGTTLYVHSGGSDTLRINLIKNGLIFLQDHFFLGTGIGNIEYHMAHSAVYPVGWVANIHNWWMEILVTSGFLIFIPYVYLYIRNAWLLYKLPRITHDKDVSVISASFFGFIIAFVVSSMSSSSLFTSEWLWPSMALIFSFVNYGYEHEQKITQ